MTWEEELENYEYLAKSLDELTARFIRETNALPSEVSIVELLQWCREKISFLESKWKQ